jgi:hypothetical protein
MPKNLINKHFFFKLNKIRDLTPAKKIYFGVEITRQHNQSGSHGRKINQILTSGCRASEIRNGTSTVVTK